MKLTNEQRNNIIKAAMADCFIDEKNKYEQMRVELGDALYKWRFGEYEDIANQLPQNWLPSSNEITISMPGFKSYFGGINCPANLKMTKPRRFPHHFYSLEVGPNDPVYEQALLLLAEYEALEAKKETLKSTLRGILYSVSTLDKLRALWPEGEKYFPVQVATQTSVVPYDLVASANKIMGLPKVEK